MPRVQTARHLHRFFPVLAEREVTVEGTTAAEVVRAMDAVAPGFSDYIVDERGALRRHVNVFIDNEMVVDRRSLSDRVPEGATVYIMQALSGG
jgi:predicted phage tail protein